MTDRGQGGTVAWCTCEHERHLSEHADEASRGHAYGTKFPASVSHVCATPWGLFVVCPQCAHDCYAEWRPASRCAELECVIQTRSGEPFPGFTDAPIAGSSS